MFIVRIVLVQQVSGLPRKTKTKGRESTKVGEARFRYLFYVDFLANACIPEIELSAFRLGVRKSVQSSPVGEAAWASHQNW